MLLEYRLIKEQIYLYQKKFLPYTGLFELLSLYTQKTKMYVSCINELDVEMSMEDTFQSKKTISFHVSALAIDLKDWANMALSIRISKNILDELLHVYTYKDSLKIYGISILRVCNHGIKNYDLEEASATSVLSDFSRKLRLCTRHL